MVAWKKSFNNASPQAWAWRGFLSLAVPIQTSIQYCSRQNVPSAVRGWSAWWNVIHPLPHHVGPCCLPAQLLPGEVPVTPSWKCHPALCWICLAYWILRRYGRYSRITNRVELARCCMVRGLPQHLVNSFKLKINKWTNCGTYDTQLLPVGLVLARSAREITDQVLRPSERVCYGTQAMFLSEQVPSLRQVPDPGDIHYCQDVRYRSPPRDANKCHSCHKWNRVLWWVSHQRPVGNLRIRGSVG